jgi:hypothetical protein
MKRELKVRLNAAIHEVISGQSAFISAAGIVDLLKHLHPGLWHEAREVIATEFVAAMAKRAFQSPIHQPNSNQLTLAGFEDVPKYIRTQKRWMDIRDANLQELNEYADWYRAELARKKKVLDRERRILTAIERLAAIVARFDRKTPGITLNTALELRQSAADSIARREPA